jgi:hypothetical protein
MTQDEIIEMAKQAGVIQGFNSVHPSIEAFAKLVAQHEREVCAKICDAEQKKNEDNGQWLWEAKICGIAIRARGQA